MAARKKPWYRARNVVLMLLLLLALVVGREVYLAYHVERGSAIDYAQQLQELDLRRQGASENEPNGWEELSAAYAVMDEAVLAVEKEAEPSPPPEHVQRWGQREWPVGFRFLLEREEVTPVALEQTLHAASLIEERGGLEHLASAVAHKKVVPPKIAVRPLVMAPLDKQAANYARLVAWRFETAAAEDRQEDMEGAASTLLGLARVYSTQGTLLNYLVGAGCADRLLSSIRHVISRGELGEGEALALLESLERRFDVGDFASLVEVARLETLDGIQRAYTPGGRRILYHPDGSLPGRVGGDHPLFNCASLFFPRRDADVEDAEQFFGEWRTLAAMESSELGGAADPGRNLTGKGVIRGAAEFIVAPIGKIRHVSDRLALAHAGTRVMLLLEVYRAQHGAYPQALQALPQDLAGGTLADPISGEPFGYRLLEPGTDAAGRAYLLYSRGLDGRDDGGVELRQRYRAIEASPGVAPEVGVDFVINAPEEGRAEGNG